MAARSTWLYFCNFLNSQIWCSCRIILNLKKLHDHVPYIHLKMDTIKSVLNLVTQNCYMAKIDINDAYYSIPIIPEHQKFLKFTLQGKLYKFTCLHNGLCSVSRKPLLFSLLKTALAILRFDYIKIAAYIDDLTTLAYSFDVCFKKIWKCVKPLGNLGFVVHPEKSDFVPSQ